MESEITGRSVSVHIEVAASAESVWVLISDIELLPRFSEELLSVAWVDDARGLGARFTGTNSHPLIGQWTTRCQVVEYHPPTTFGWSVGDPDRPAALWRFETRPTGPASCVLSQTAELGPGRSGVTMLIDRQPRRADEIVTNRLGQFRDSMHTTVDGIKRLAEAAARREAADVT